MRYCCVRMSETHYSYDPGMTGYIADLVVSPLVVCVGLTGYW